MSNLALEEQINRESEVDRLTHIVETSPDGPMKEHLKEQLARAISKCDGDDPHCRHVPLRREAGEFE